MYFSLVLIKFITRDGTKEKKMCHTHRVSFATNETASKWISTKRTHKYCLRLTIFRIRIRNYIIIVTEGQSQLKKMWTKSTNWIAVKYPKRTYNYSNVFFSMFLSLSGAVLSLVRCALVIFTVSACVGKLVWLFHGNIGWAFIWAIVNSVLFSKYRAWAVWVWYHNVRYS